MITFIIVDDEVEYQDELKKIIRNATFNTEHNIKIKCYSKYSKELQRQIDDKSHQKVYLLDIDLKTEITGINIALKVRENDWDSEIIFLTNHDSYFEKVYRNIYKVFNFIEKFDHMNKRLTKDINAILSKKYDVGVFKYHNSQVDLHIYLKNIIYIYRDTSLRKLTIVTDNNTFLVSISIADILKKLDSRFIQVYRSCIVNIERITMFNWNEGYFVLEDGKEIHMLSKKYRNIVLKKRLS